MARRKAEVGSAGEGAQTDHIDLCWRIQHYIAQGHKPGQVFDAAGAWCGRTAREIREIYKVILPTLSLAQSDDAPSRKGVAVSPAKPVPMVRLVFSDTTHLMPLSSWKREEQKRYHEMEVSDSIELRVAARPLLDQAAHGLTQTVIRSFEQSEGGRTAAKAKINRASERKAIARKRFNALIATGDRDAQEAMNQMVREGYKHRSLQRYLSEDLARIGRGRRIPVKRPTR